MKNLIITQLENKEIIALDTMTFCLAEIKREMITQNCIDIQSPETGQVVDLSMINEALNTLINLQDMQRGFTFLK